MRSRCGSAIVVAAVVIAGARVASAQDSVANRLSTSPWQGAVVAFAEKDRRFVGSFNGLASPGGLPVFAQVQLEAPLDEETRRAAFVSNSRLVSGFVGRLSLSYDTRATLTEARMGDSIADRACRLALDGSASRSPGPRVQTLLQDAQSALERLHEAQRSAGSSLNTARTTLGLANVRVGAEVHAGAWMVSWQRSALDPPSPPRTNESLRAALDARIVETREALEHSTRLIEQIASAESELDEREADLRAELATAVHARDRADQSAFWARLAVERATPRTVPSAQAALSEALSRSAEAERRVASAEAPIVVNGRASRAVRRARAALSALRGPQDALIAALLQARSENPARPSETRCEVSGIQHVASMPMVRDWLAANSNHEAAQQLRARSPDAVRQISRFAVPMSTPSQFFYSVGVDVSLSFDRLSVYQTDLAERAGTGTTAANPTDVDKWRLRAAVAGSLFSGVGLAAHVLIGTDVRQSPDTRTVRRCESIASGAASLSGQSCEDVLLLRSAGAPVSVVPIFARVSAVYLFRPVANGATAGIEGRAGLEGLTSDNQRLEWGLTGFLSPQVDSVAPRFGLGITVSHPLGAQGLNATPDFTPFAVVGVSP